MAVTRGATISDDKISTSVTSSSFSHTVDSGTTLLLVYVGQEGNEDLVGVPSWNTTEDMTLIHQMATTGSNQDTRGCFFGLVNPTATTANIATTFTNANNPAWIAAVNYLGTETASVAAATNFLSEDQNTTGTSTAVHSSAGTSGNALILAGHGQGADMQPASQTAGTTFTEVFDVQTGTSNSADFGCWLGELLDSAPSAITVTWGATDENSSIYIEIVAASSDTNVSANTDALVLAEQQATVAVDHDIQAGTDALVIAEQPATIAVDHDIQAGTDALVLTENSATIAVDHNIQATTDPLIIAEFPATVSTGSDTDVQATTDALVLTEQQATVSVDHDIQAGIDALVLTENQATVAVDHNIQATTDPLVVAEQQATIAVDHNIQATTDALILSELAASILVDHNIQAGTDALLISPLQATVDDGLGGGPVAVPYNSWRKPLGARLLGKR